MSKIRLKEVQQALEKKGWTKKDLAIQADCSLPTSYNFLKGEAVQKDIFQNLCYELGLKWQGIVDWDIEKSANKDLDSSRETCDAMDISTKPTDKNEHPNKIEKSPSCTAVFTVSGLDLLKIKAIQDFLQKEAGDFSIKIVDIEEGSVKLTLEGSQSGLEQIEALFKSGQLAEVLGIPILDAQFITNKNSEQDKKRLLFTIDASISQEDLQELKALLTKAPDNKNEESKTDEKSRLAQEIRSQGARRRDLSGVNLSRANLRDANLSRANLSRANLRDANLSGANLRDANLIDTDLRDADLRDADLRGADLRKADLRKADLRGANWRGANWRDANLTGTDLSSINQVKNAQNNIIICAQENGNPNL